MKIGNLKITAFLTAFMMTVALIPISLQNAAAAELIPVPQNIDISPWLNADTFSKEGEEFPTGANWTNLSLGGGFDLEQFEKLKAFQKDSNTFFTDNASYKMYNLYAPAQSANGGVMTPTNIFTGSGAVTVGINKAFEKIYFLATAHNGTGDYSVSVEYTDGSVNSETPIVGSTGTSVMGGAYSWNSKGQKNVFAGVEAVGPDGKGGYTRNNFTYVYEYYIEPEQGKTVKSITFGKVVSIDQGVHIFSLSGINTISAGEITAMHENGDAIDLSFETVKENGGYSYIADFGENEKFSIKSVKINLREENEEIFGKTVYGSNDKVNYYPLATVTKAHKAQETEINAASEEKWRYIKIEDCAVPSVFEAKITASDSEKEKTNVEITGKITAEGNFESGNEWYKAFDGDEITYARASEQNGNAFIIYTGENELYKPCTVSVRDDSEALTGVLYASVDGNAYEKIADINENDTAVSADKYYNWFKFSCDYNCVSEFKLYGDRNDGSYAVITNVNVSGDGVTGVPLKLTYNIRPAYAESIIKWYCGGELIENETKSEIIPQKAGTYYAVVSSRTGGKVKSNDIEVALDNIPTAENVIAEGELHAGETLRGSYTTVDLDGHATTQTLRWYRGDTAIEDADSDSYTLTDEDVGKVISFGVTPYSVSPDVKGQEVRFTFPTAVLESKYEKLTRFTFEYPNFHACFDGDIESRPYFGLAPETRVIFTFPDGETHSLDKFRYHTAKDAPSMADAMIIEGTNDFVNFDILYKSDKEHEYKWYTVPMDNFKKYKAFSLRGVSTGRVAELEFYEKKSGYVTYPAEFKLLGKTDSGILDIGSTYPENLTCVKFDTDNPSAYNGKKIYGSNDNTNWTILGTIENTVSGENSIEIRSGGLYRYFKCDVGVDFYGMLYDTEYPLLSNLKFKNTAAVGGKLEAVYEFSAVNGTADTDKFLYRWYKSENGDSWTEISGANAKEYTVRNSDLGNYIKCEITPVSTQAPYGKNTFSAVTEEKIGALGIPQAENVKLSGVVKAGNTLTLTYDYYDPNGVNEKDSEIIWYKSSDNQNWEKLTNDNLKTYTVKAEDENSFIRASVVPMSESGVISGKTVKGELMWSNSATYACAPVARDVKITANKPLSDIESGDKLTVEYTYYDANMDEENGTSVIWKRGNMIVASGKEYTLTEDDTEKTLDITIKVKNTGELGDDAQEVKLSVKAPSAPKAENVRITGGASVGKTLTVTYDFKDENGNASIGTEASWYSYTQSISQKTLIGTGFSYTVKSADKGKYIVCEIIPKTNIKPMTGTAVLSDSVKIKENGTAGSGGGSSSGGGGGGGGLINKSVQQNEFVPTVPEKEPEQEYFPDVKDHWAKNEINELAKKGIVKGNGTGYAPDNLMTRAESLAVIVRALGLNENTEYKGILYDVSKDDWYAGVLQASYEAKIFTGIGYNFEPNKQVTREEFCNYVINAYISKTSKIPEKADLSAFSDTSEMSFSDSAAQAVGLGIMKGITPKVFAPKENATRAQVAVMIIRLLSLLDK